MRPKSVGIDGFNLATGKGSGIATYARNLIVSLRRLGVEGHILYGPRQTFGNDNLGNEIALFDAPPTPSPARRAAEIIGDLVRPLPRKGVPARWISPTGEVITRQVDQGMPPCDGVWAIPDLFHSANWIYSARGKFTQVRFVDGPERGPGVMHWTSPIPLRAPGGANLYTLHDLVPLRLPFATLDNKRRFMKLCRDICATADQVVTVSEHSRQDIVRILGIEEKRVSVTYQAVDLPENLIARADDEVAKEIAGVFGLEWRGYFIFFGAIEPKKNLARVIEAYLGSGVAAPLIIIGGKAWLDDDETRLMYPDLIERSVLRDGVIRRADRVRKYDYLPFPLLVSLIRGARATLLPSLYEGFGLPVLESMQLGTPVLTSTAGALPEIAGDAAILVDPYDVQAIRRGILALDADAELRADLAEKGRAQAAKFSPAAYQQRLTSLYQPFF